MSDNKPTGQEPSGGDAPPAPPAKSTEEQLKEVLEAQKAMNAELQASREELKRVSNLNGVLMSRIKTDEPDRGMDANRTVPIKLRRDFSQMDPTADPKRFAEEVVLEAAEQVSATVARMQEAQSSGERLRRSFYEKNKDLVGYEIEVGHFSGEVQAANPGINFEQAADLVAQRVRAYLKERGLSSPANPNAPDPLHVLPSGGASDGRVPVKEPKKDEPFDAAKEYDKDMKSYAEERNKERNRTLSKA